MHNATFTHKNVLHSEDTELIQLLTQTMKRPITTVSPLSEYLIRPGCLITALYRCLELWLVRVQ